MKTLWAPWRMEYLLSKKRDDCLFCEILKEQEDRENLILNRSSHCFVVMNRYPYNNGHIMVVPNIHTSNLEDIPEKDLIDFGKTTQFSLKCLKKLLKPEGFNIGMNIGGAAGAGIKEHVHLHIVPRWGGDTSFMTSISEVKVVSEHIMKTYDKLLPLFNHK